MNEYDARQLNLMIQKINSFKSGKLYLCYLINDLEALLNVLEEKDKNWEVEFRGYWWDLEEIYAVALDNEQLNLNLRQEGYIYEAIENLEKLIKSKLQTISKNDENNLHVINDE